MKKNKILVAAITILLALPTLQANANEFGTFQWGDLLFAPGNDPVPPGISLQPLLTITSNKNKNVDYLRLMLNQEGQIAGMYSEPDQNNQQGGAVDPGSRNLFPIDEILGNKGSVLIRASGRDALIIQGDLAEADGEGLFFMKYLSNGLFMRYESCEVILRRGTGGWYLENAYTGKPVDQIHIVTHSLGIDTVRGICKAK